MFTVYAQPVKCDRALWARASLPSTDRHYNRRSRVNPSGLDSNDYPS